MILNLVRSDKRPWEHHPALTLERVVMVADILRRTRDSAARAAKWGLGDNLWTIGTQAYARAIHQLTLAAVAEYAAWLSIKTADNIHLVNIGMVPVRHYRGIEDMPVPTKHRATGVSESDAVNLAFAEEGMEPINGHFRFEVRTNAKGFTTDIFFVLVDGVGERRDPWQVPTTVARPVVRRGAVRLPSAAELLNPKPSIDNVPKEGS